MKYTFGYLIAVMIFMTGCVVAINTGEERELTEEERIELKKEAYEQIMADRADTNAEEIFPSSILQEEARKEVHVEAIEIAGEAV